MSLTGKTSDAHYYHGRDGFGDVPDTNAPRIDQAQSESAVAALQRLARDHKGNLSFILVLP